MKIGFDRNMQIGEVGMHARRIIKRAMIPLVVIIGASTAILAGTGRPGAGAFLLIGLGNLLMLGTWAAKGKGIPLVPLFAFQNLVAYGLPLLTQNESVMSYPVEYLARAGWEVFAFSLSLTICWRVADQAIARSSPFCYALYGFDTGMQKLGRFGLVMVCISSAFEILRSVQLLDFFLGMLPSGSESIVRVLVSAVGACGFFLTAMMIGNGSISGIPRLLFWVLLALQCFISAAGFLLSAAVLVIFSAMIGLFWGSGKVPWRFFVITLALFSFLNLGKFTMRDKYWRSENDDPMPEFTLTDMPRYYGEWIDASVSMLSGRGDDDAHHNAFSDLTRTKEAEAESGQSLLKRINNLQNLLYVIDAMDSRHIPALNGATYSLIPPLLVPRIIWPQKPRTHEGQVLLNVHFGRQEAVSTLRTYVAWGLIAEAYGNFGPIAGTAILGAVLGLLFAWMEKYVARKLLLSVEGFLAFTIFLGLANSFEMVASVLVTSLFQACIPIVLASWPFVRRASSEARPSS